MSTDTLHTIFTRASPTAADRAVRNAIQVAHVKQLWYFLACVLAFFTLVQVVRYAWSKLTPPPQQRTPINEKEDKEKNITPQATYSAFHRTLTAFSTGFRIAFFRWTIPIGPGAITSMTELTFIFSYIAANFIWLLVDSKQIVLHIVYSLI